MEDLALLDLLECPLCSEPLDATAKVLPCQHTFCKPCLERQEALRLPLCCPECRSPAPGMVHELPANLLLVRLLEGLHQGPLGSPRDRYVRYVGPLAKEDSISMEFQDPQPTQHRQGQGQGQACDGVYARALYNYIGNVPRELSVKSGDLINLRWRVDENWYHGDAKGSSGLVPANMVEVMSQQPQPLPLCRALHDFDVKDLDPEDSKNCLTFLKGDTITVIKQVDENWIEGKLGDKVGIFPLQFTEPNPAAFKLLEKRKGSDSAESRPQILRGSCERVTADSGGHRRLFGTQRSPAGPPDVSVLNGLNHPGQGQGRQSPHISFTAPPASSKPPRVAPFAKHRSGSTRRSLPKGGRKMNSEAPPTITMALINPQASTASSENKQSTQQLSISVCAALYSYKPHRAEELELRKGEMVGVYGKFKEGWLRGLSLRTGKVGILPGNYVTPVLRTSARFMEPKPAPLSTSTASGRRHTPHKTQAVVLDRVNASGTTSLTGHVPTVTMAQQPVMSSVSAMRAPQPVGKQGWDTVRRAFHPTHRGSAQRESYHSQNPTPGLQPHTQDLGQIYGLGRSPVLQRKRNGLFTNPIRPQCWTSEGIAPSGGGFQTVDRDAGSKEAWAGPQSILVKPDTHKHNTEKPTKSVRFLTQDAPQAATRTTPLTSVGQIFPSSQPCTPAMELWNPSAILGRDGSSSVLRDTKSLTYRKGMGQQDCLPFNMKPSSTLSTQSSPSRHRVAMGYAAQTDAELNLNEGELVQVQRLRQDGRVLVTQEGNGKTGLFHNNVMEILDKLI